MNTHLAHILENVPAAKIPKEVKAAIDFESAAAGLVRNLEAQQEPNLEDAKTPDDLNRVHSAAVLFQTSREVSRVTASALLRIAQDRLERAWAVAVSGLTPYFAEKFDKAAASLYATLKTIDDPHALLAEHWKPESEALREILEELQHLGSIRDSYAHMAGPSPERLCSIEYEKSSRTATFETSNLEQHFRFLVRQRDQNYWLTLAQLDGARIVWQTPEQQAEQPEPAAILRHRNQMQSLVPGHDQYGNVYHVAS